MGLTCSLLPTHVPHRVKLLSGGPDYFSEILELFFVIYVMISILLVYSTVMYSKLERFSESTRKKAICKKSK